MEDSSTPVGLHGPLADLRAALDVARTTSTAVVVDGVEGAGLTTAVSSFVDTIGDDAVTVRRARGLHWESGVSGGILRQLLGDDTGPDEPVAAAEHLALGLHTDDAVATVIIVDDAHHADVHSMQVVMSAVRHRPGAHLLVVATRHPLSGNDPRIDAVLDTADRIIPVDPLGPEDVAQLAARHGMALRPTVAARLAAHTLGRPRAVLALVREAPRDIWTRTDASLPAPRYVAARVTAALEECDAAARRMTEAVSVLGAPTDLTVVSGMAHVDDPWSAVDTGVRAGLLTAHERSQSIELDTVDPMTRVAVLATMSRTAVAAMHHAAADALDDEARALAHRARATALPDRSLADDLVAMAARRGADGEWATAADLFAVAGRMGTDVVDRETTFLRSVDALISAGDIARAADHVAAVESLRETPLRDSVLGYLAILRGRPQEASARLRRAWETVRPVHDPEIAAMICHRQVLHSLARCDGLRLVRWADEAVALVGADHPVAVEVGAIRGLGLGATGRMREALLGYENLWDHNKTGPVGQRVQMGAGWLHLAADEVARARTELESATPTDHLGGSTRIALWAHAWLARTCFVTGDWTGAMRTARAGVDLAERTGTRLMIPLLEWTITQIHALRGDWAAADAATRSRDIAGHDYEVMRVPAALARAAVAEARTDYAGVLRALAPLTGSWARGDVAEPGFWPWPDVYANALVVEGRLDEAETFLAEHEEPARDRDHRSARARLAYARGRLLGARGLVDAAVETFEGALADLDDLPLVYDRARVEFAYGQTLRRAGRRRDADVVITDARDHFRSFGATTYVLRCERELRAGGVRAVIADRPHDALTPQEEAVAALVATGMTNREAAAELFLSVKTVQYHLTRVYAKLGVRTRSELAARRGAEVAARRGAEFAARRGTAPDPAAPDAG
ncbi:LuxR C-terminal-related transcriptional regulator [Williamsia sp. MIQD14]|uniref:LuxR C-terminal-related transcriptional regulator n=1 Tax=Williamsia sp. MIQD14 TaxID=3425703 RepID=UPI003DA14960